MPYYFLFAWMASSGLIFLVPSRFKTYLSIVLSSILCTGVSIYALSTLIGGNLYQWTASLLPGPQNALRMDGLSAFFCLLIVWVSWAGTLYTKGYVSKMKHLSSHLSLSAHLFAYLCLPASMVLCVLAVDGTSFLLGWELMTLCTFVLVLFESYDRSKIHAAISYLVQMHICFFLLVLAFTLAYIRGHAFGWDGVANAFAQSPSNLKLFLLFLAGFGVKAGLFPLHTWLPMIHPKATGNVSGLMSGIVIKMGIYGILRTLSLVQNDFIEIGIWLASIGMITAIYGIILACLQKDIKRMLAYSSIENMGLITLALGLGMIGKESGMSLLSVAAFGGALLHVFNHAFYKTLLFFSAGSLLQSVGTTNLNLLGGLSKRIPILTVMFLIGAMAICALPPFSGFVSEYMVYRSAFNIFSSAEQVSLGMVSFAALAIVCLALVGGLSVMAFGKAFGIGFLGNARSALPKEIREPSKWSLGAMGILVIPVLAVGFFPSIFANITSSIAGDYFQLEDSIFTRHSITFNLYKIGIVGGILLTFSILLWMLKKWHMKRHPMSEGPTWGCGYHAPNAKIQYTGSSFTDVFGILARPLQGYRTELSDKLDPKDMFPKQKQFKTKHVDWVQHMFLERPMQGLSRFFQRIEMLQTGKIHHYVMMALVFILFLIILSHWNN